jgi:hypothetical protein
MTGAVLPHFVPGLDVVLWLHVCNVEIFAVGHGPVPAMDATERESACDGLAITNVRFFITGTPAPIISPATRAKWRKPGGSPVRNPGQTPRTNREYASRGV